MRTFFVLCSSVGMLLCAHVAQAHIEKFRVFEMTGALENGPVDTPGFGTALITFDLDLITMRVQAEYENLRGTVSAAHIHCCTNPPGNVGVASRNPSFLNFPTGTSGTYDHTYDMTLASSYHPTFLANNGGLTSAALQTLLNAANATSIDPNDGKLKSRAYFNIHTSFQGSGEIRGYLIPVPEPGSCALVGLGVAGAFWRRRTR